MALTEKIKFIIETDASDADKLNAVLEEVEENEKKVGDQGKKAGESITAGFIKAQAIIAAVKTAFRGIVNITKEAVSAAIKQEDAEKKLSAALGGVNKELLDHATQLQRATKFGDETIIGAQALIGSFVKETDAIKAATEASLDLAEAKGFDLVSAADLVSKTLGSSTNALSRYGIEVEGAVGSTERLESLTKSVATIFGGQAAAATETFGGATQQLSNVWGDLLERIGAMITQNPVVLEAINQLSVFIQGLTDDLEGNSSMFKQWLDLVSAVIIAGISTVEGLIKAWRFFEATVKEVGASTLGTMSNVVSEIASIWGRLPGKIGEPFRAIETISSDIAVGLRDNADEAWQAWDEGVPSLRRLRKELEAVQGTSLPQVESATRAVIETQELQAEATKKQTEETKKFGQALLKVLEAEDELERSRSARQKESTELIGQITEQGMSPAEKLILDLEAQQAALLEFRETEIENLTAFEQAKADIQTQIDEAKTALLEENSQRRVEAWMNENQSLVRVTGSMQRAFSAAIAGIVSGQMTGEQAIKSLLSALLNALAQEAQAQAAKELALGFAALGARDSEAARNHFTAAALWTVAGGIAAGLAAAAAPDSESGGGAGGEAGARGGGDGGTATDTRGLGGQENETAQGAVNIEINGGTFVGSSPRELATNIADEINRQSARGSITLRPREVGRRTLRG